MHLHFYFSRTVEAYNYDCTSDHAIWPISLVYHRSTHAFKLANCNGFYFNAYPLGLSPNGTLHLSMVLYDPRTMTYVNSNEDIYATQLRSGEDPELRNTLKNASYRGGWAANCFNYSPTEGGGGVWAIRSSPG